MILEISNVTKKFSNFTLGPINLKIQEKDILVIIGPTGSGKSTLLNLVSGLLQMDKGSIYVDGLEISKHPIECRSIGYCFQNPYLFPHLNVYENIIFGIKGKDSIRKKAQIERYLELFEIEHLIDRNIHGLSGGEKQKISLARMLIREPKIMLMDEPLANLDNQTKQNLRIYLRKILKKLGITGIYVTHFEDDIYALADSISIIKKGQIEYVGKLQSFLVNKYNFKLQSQSSSFSDIYQIEYNYLEGPVIDSKNGITLFSANGHKIEIIGNYTTGTTVGIVIKPEDIILSLEPVRTTARNVISAQIIQIYENPYKSGVLDIYLSTNKIELLSRITLESKNQLGINKGQIVYIIFKTTSPKISRENQ